MVGGGWWVVGGGFSVGARSIGGCNRRAATKRQQNSRRSKNTRGSTAAGGADSAPRKRENMNDVHDTARPGFGGLGRVSEVSAHRGARAEAGEAVVEVTAGAARVPDPEFAAGVAVAA